MAIDVDKHIIYWRGGALESIESAKVLFEKSRIVHSLFFCHLAIEKALKALVIKATADIPPKTHNLIRLLEFSTISHENEFVDFLGEMMEFQLEGRYPSLGKPEISMEKAQKYIQGAEDKVKWLISLL